VSVAIAHTSELHSLSHRVIGNLQLVGFRLADEEYGLEITKVQEIILPCEFTRIPYAPRYVKGLINLRSTVLPIIDLRLRFALPSQQITDDTRIIVVTALGRTVGIVVDSVTEVLQFTRDRIVPPPPVIAGLGRDYIMGLAQLDGRLLILLDVDRILHEEDAASNAAFLT
jgi:purine-binding chemotaxis protein CheW